MKIDVSERLEKRALDIFRRIFIEVEKHGHHFEVEKNRCGKWRGCTTYIVVRNHKIAVMVREIRKRVHKDDDSWWRTTCEDTGRLKFVFKDLIFNWSDSYMHCAAQDTPKICLEDKIGHIVEVLEKHAAKKDRDDELIRKEHERLRLEEEKKRLEEEERLKIEARKKYEIDKIKDLLVNADRFNIARLIRLYADNYVKISPPGNVDEMYVRWMYDKADFLDPFVNRKDEYLEESDINRIIGCETIGVNRIMTGSCNSGTDLGDTFWQNRNGWRK